LEHEGGRAHSAVTDALFCEAIYDRLRDLRRANKWMAETLAALPDN
jgi:hypothetical protein